MPHLIGEDMCLICVYCRLCLWRMLFFYWLPLGCSPWCPGTPWASQLQCSAAFLLVTFENIFHSSILLDGNVTFFILFYHLFGICLFTLYRTDSVGAVLSFPPPEVF